MIMIDLQNDKEEIVINDEKLIVKWGKRNPRFEKKYEDSVMRVLSTYGQKATEYTETTSIQFSIGPLKPPERST